MSSFLVYLVSADRNKLNGKSFAVSRCRNCSLQSGRDVWDIWCSLQTNTCNDFKLCHQHAPVNLMSAFFFYFTKLLSNSCFSWVLLPTDLAPTPLLATLATGPAPERAPESLRLLLVHLRRPQPAYSKHHQRRCQARTAVACSTGGARRARTETKVSTNDKALLYHRPPTSQASTTSCAEPLSTSSG